MCLHICLQTLSVLNAYSFPQALVSEKRFASPLYKVRGKNIWVSIFLCQMEATVYLIVCTPYRKCLFDLPCWRLLPRSLHFSPQCLSHTLLVLCSFPPSFCFCFHLPTIAHLLLSALVNNSSISIQATWLKNANFEMKCFELCSCHLLT